LTTKTCDRCPDNCKECEVSGSSLNCKVCVDRYALNNANKQCVKCPENCKECEYKSPKTECKSTSSADHKCIEKEKGKSWTIKKSDGTCVACPNLCDKCYLRQDTDSIPACYASACQMGSGFKDADDSCVSCGTGCDHCKIKEDGTPECLRCAAKYALDSSDDSCKSCSVANCDYCVVENKDVVCRHSSCDANSNQKYDFTTNTCIGTCLISKRHVQVTEGSMKMKLAIAGIVLLAVPLYRRDQTQACAKAVVKIVKIVD
jgi:hypothetical protein